MEKRESESVNHLDYDPYQPTNLLLFETLYGKHLLSLGGTTAIANMFSGLTHLKGLRAIDIGFGLGGVAFYLAEHYQMHISGVEINEWMVEYARQHTAAHLKNMVEFDYYSGNNLPYPDQIYDLAYSKGVLNHVSDKLSLFREVARVLKPGARFVIADWISPKIDNADVGSPLVSETEQSYREVLLGSGFENIEFRDDSHLFAGYIIALLQNLTRHTNLIEQNYGDQLLTAITFQHENLLTQISQQKKFAVRILAERSD